MKTAQKQPFLDTKSALERARRLEMAQNLLQVMRICSAVVLSYLDAGFEPRCPQQDFFNHLLLLLGTCCMLKCVTHPWTLRRVVKPRQGKPSSVTRKYRARSPNC